MSWYTLIGAPTLLGFKQKIDPTYELLHFWVTNPCRITRKVKQTKMYVCTLEEFILVDLDTLLCKLEVN